MDKSNDLDLSIRLDGYADAPLAAVVGLPDNSRTLVCFLRDDASAARDCLLRGGLDGIGGLHEHIRWSAHIVLRDAEHRRGDVVESARRWAERLGPHAPPHVVRDAKGRIVSVKYAD